MAKKKDEKDVLVVRDEKTGEISVVAGLNADGTPKRTPAKAENAQSFLQFDRHGDVLDNFFKNFFRQCKEPSRFGFYRIAADQAENLLEVMKQLLKDPEANKELLAPHKVDTSDYEKKVQEEMAAQQTEKQEPQKQENMEQRKEQQQDKSEQMQGKRGYQPIDESKINWQELDSGAVAITDREKLLAFTGIGDDHHLPGKPISSTYTLKAIETGEVVYADGNEVPYRCSLHPQCKLGSTLVIPLRGENQRVMGTIKLYEAKNRLFSSINRTLGEGIAQLLSAQILAGQYERQKAMLTQSEIKLLHAQVNPHFLFNALNTIKAVIRRDSEQASQLVQYLSTFFRKNLKRPSEFVTLADEIEHVNAYLQIEKARFQSRLQVNIAIPQELSQQQLPAFTLQPIVENAIKHGTSQLLDTGRVAISARREGQHLMLEIEDNAGLYQPVTNASGLGMNLVDKRLRERFGDDYGISVACEPDSYTRITLRLPWRDEA